MAMHQRSNNGIVELKWMIPQQHADPIHLFLP
jgi:hypothetical protein